jgi:hypothetical protein
MAEKNNCGLLAPPARDYCEQDTGGQGGGGGGSGAGGGITDGASDHVKDLANILIKKIEELLAPNDAWAPEKADSALYEPFLWLGQHLAVAIFVCVVVVLARSAWHGAPARPGGGPTAPATDGCLHRMVPRGCRLHGVGPGGRHAA